MPHFSFRHYKARFIAFTRERPKLTIIGLGLLFTFVFNEELQNSIRHETEHKTHQDS